MKLQESNSPIKVVIVDDHLLYSRSLSYLLKTIAGFIVLFEAANGSILFEQLDLLLEMPQVILLDVQMPLMNGVETSALLQQKYPCIKVVALTMFTHEHLIMQLFSNGVVGYLSKNIEIDVLIAAIHAANQSRHFYIKPMEPFSVMDSKWFDGIRVVKKLTTQQKKFLQYCASNYTYKEIATLMEISIKTVDRYRDDLFKQLNVKNRVELSIYAIKTGHVNLLY